MCEFCGCGTGRPMERPSIREKTTNVSTVIRVVEIAEPSAKAAVGGGENRRANSTIRRVTRTEVGPREVSERGASADY